MIVHSYCAIKKKYQKGFASSFKSSLPLSTRLHNFTGAFLSVLLMGHITIFRILPLVKFGKEKAALIDITEVTYSAKVEKMEKVMFPMLSALFAAGFYHTFYGLNQSNWLLRKKRLISQYSNVWKVVAVLGAVGGIAAMSAATGKLFDVEISHPELFSKIH